MPCFLKGRTQFGVQLLQSASNAVRDCAGLTSDSAAGDIGDYVVIINAEKVVLTGKKEEKNEYMFFSGFVGGESRRSLKLMRENHPEFIITHAVKGMLPKNRIAAQMLTKLRVFKGPAHTHEAQNPVKISA